MRLYDLLNEQVDKNEILHLLNSRFKITGFPSVKIDDSGYASILATETFVNVECKLLESITTDGTIPVRFNNVAGTFLCQRTGLTSLHNSPKIVKGYFNCFGNKLTNLIGGPEEVGTEYNCYLNPLESLDGLPKKAGSFRAGYFPNMPLLKILQIVGLTHIKLLSSDENAEIVTEILNRYLGKGKSGIIQCAAELSKAGFKRNARL